MLEQLFSGPALTWVFGETAVNEILEFRGPSRVDLGCWVVTDIVEYTNLLIIDVGRFSLRQFNDENTKRPHVHFVVVALFTLNHLGGHPAYSAHFARASLVASSQLCRVPKISELDLSTLGN